MEESNNDHDILGAADRDYIFQDNDSENSSQPHDLLPEHHRIVVNHDDDNDEQDQEDSDTLHDMSTIGSHSAVGDYHARRTSAVASSILGEYNQVDLAATIPSISSPMILDTAHDNQEEKSQVEGQKDDGDEEASVLSEPTTQPPAPEDHQAMESDSEVGENAPDSSIVSLSDSEEIFPTKADPPARYYRNTATTPTPAPLLSPSSMEDEDEEEIDRTQEDFHSTHSTSDSVSQGPAPQEEPEPQPSLAAEDNSVQQYSVTVKRSPLVVVGLEKDAHDRRQEQAGAAVLSNMLDNDVGQDYSIDYGYDDDDIDNHSRPPVIIAPGMERWDPQVASQNNNQHFDLYYRTAQRERSDSIDNHSLSSVGTYSVVSDFRRAVAAQQAALPPPATKNWQEDTRNTSRTTSVEDPADDFPADEYADQGEDVEKAIHVVNKTSQEAQRSSPDSCSCVARVSIVVALVMFALAFVLVGLYFARDGFGDDEDGGNDYVDTKASSTDDEVWQEWIRNRENNSNNGA
uniref:Uncharacterized protein n=1 Tax=Entomoneis paludosa TaxID=265537 RepID=A0A7S2VAB2_9STRA|mmetsp:Transcript_13659/g.28214  ORF Transcript_13659/g.28214 Transcript_13659/m.28214 type:complete len:516 (+) Transcript_13659:303-1850(+)|eukprot:CAMPEP_0172460672 /NCGR_PEP_ID=MMETSP1065-20121228/37747_1 /TAXON_ID=265537 /ORGANISM="Amphiprora paludosa, Strain CCMP125" /LENGTH=515 /DNA_ID=CAMNT_0013215773 /DNA_START=236 /DNA_END=1783 /DNA_ORIENTATION=-